MIRPNKPHIEGFEDEEDCEGYYDPDEDKRRGCNILGRSPSDPCRICFEAWKVKEDARIKAEWDAKSPEEKAQHEKLVRGLRELDAGYNITWEGGRPSHKS